jgi:hypothetical protein
MALVIIAREAYCKAVAADYPNLAGKVRLQIQKWASNAAFKKGPNVVKSMLQSFGGSPLCTISNTLPAHLEVSFIS